jgi:guanylate kinase
MSDRKPLLIVVSAPSGAGKSTLCDKLLAERGNIVYSVSCTTRAPRGSEVNGVDYNFMSEPEFMARVAAGDFLEYAAVHGNYYGTLRETVSSAMESGQSVMMDIDVQGAAQVRDALAGMDPDSPLVRGFVDIFIMPPSIEELRRRLEGRGEDAPDVIETRLANAEAEMAQAGLYKYQIVNDDLERAFDEIRTLIEQEAGK